jgi:hypothetical protein
VILTGDALVSPIRKSGSFASRIAALTCAWLDFVGYSMTSRPTVFAELDDDELIITLITM